VVVVGVVDSFPPGRGAARDLLPAERADDQSPEREERVVQGARYSMTPVFFGPWLAAVEESARDNRLEAAGPLLSPGFNDPNVDWIAKNPLNLRFACENPYCSQTRQHLGR
jgi:hypothetical protein